MGLINDLATLIGAGMTVEDVKALAQMEKKGEHDEPESKAKETEQDDQGTETHEEERVEEKEDKTNEELESLRAELEESKKLIAELQEENRHRNRDGDSTKSDEDLLNDIMIDMF